MLDTLQKIETPEGVELNLRPAGPFPRLLAWLIDSLLKTAIFVIVAIVLTSLGNFFTGIAFIVLFFLLWGYNVVFEVLNKGATPGKLALRLQVVYANGAPVGWPGSILRNFLRVVDFLPGLYALGLAASLSNSRFQRFGDIAAGTVVAYRDSDNEPVRDEREHSRPLRLPLSRDEQRAVMQIGERADQLSQERCVELASILKPLTGLEGEDAVQRLRAHANWLGGRS